MSHVTCSHCAEPWNVHRLSHDFTPTRSSPSSTRVSVCDFTVANNPRVLDKASNPIRFPRENGFIMSRRLRAVWTHINRALKSLQTKNPTVNHGIGKLRGSLASGFDPDLADRICDALFK